MRVVIPFTSCACLLTLQMLGSAIAGEEIIKDAQAMDCYVYTPDDFDPNQTYQLVVGVHGAGGSSGKNAGGLKSWAQRGDVIVMGPAFVTKGQQPYQSGDGIHAEKLIKLFKEVGEKYKLREKMFIHGFSGGSQFAHRFALRHPEYVCGVSAHSGGSWATDNFAIPTSAKTKQIPFAISCGENDKAKAWGEAPWVRIEWFKRFEKEAESKKLTYIAATWPGVGHRPSAGVKDLLKQCFQLATGLPGESATQRVEISDQWKNLGNLPVVELPKDESPSTPYVNPNELKKKARAAFAIADKENVSDVKLVRFMEQYPPILWREMEGSDELLKQCQAAAKRWKMKSEQAGTFEGEVKRRYEKFSNGLNEEAK